MFLISGAAVLTIVSALLPLWAVSLAADINNRDVYHNHKRYDDIKFVSRNEDELDAAYWTSEAQAALRARLNVAENLHAAKNVIMFLGDGMSVTTLAAARTLMGQRANRTGEEAALAFETFPIVGLAKTYCIDHQVADSACTATAYLCGYKGNRGTIGVTGRVSRGDCFTSTDPGTHVMSMADWALASGREVGLVTTTRVTNASPAGLYAHVAERDWEDDTEVIADGCDPNSQRDIAYQLVHHYPGNRFKVILGGGRREFLSKFAVDEEGTSGKRTDERNLIEEWREDKRLRNESHAYIWSRDELKALDLERTSYLMGLFEGNHLRFNMLTDPVTEPTLEELTETAIRMLEKNDEGYFLFVEGGRIDHGHHDNLVRLALDETIEFSKAVQRAIELTSEQDTLIVVTSDHSHVMAFNGYSHRGNDILGPSDDQGNDGVPYMTLSYTNGPGFRPHVESGVRDDVTRYDYRSAEFAYPADVPLDEETHGGEDVAVFARGPQQHVFTGLYEQSQLPHLMGYAACLGPGLHAPACHHNNYNFPQ